MQKYNLLASRHNKPLGMNNVVSYLLFNWQLDKFDGLIRVQSTVIGYCPVS